MNTKVIKIAGTGRETVASIFGLRCDQLAPAQAACFAKRLNAARSRSAAESGTRYEVRQG